MKRPYGGCGRSPGEGTDARGESVKVTSKGQITLPRALRDRLGIRQGDYLEASIDQDRLILKPIPPQTTQEAIREHWGTYGTERATLEEARRILRKVPYSLSGKTIKLREE
jgi:AbrB family looped-hinge helix DNA binding protein